MRLGGGASHSAPILDLGLATSHRGLKLGEHIPGFVPRMTTACSTALPISLIIHRKNSREAGIRRGIRRFFADSKAR
jgi:hypothetical protein